MSLPVVDFSHFQCSDASIRQVLAKQIVKAFEDVGFLYLVGHGLDEKMVDAVFTQNVEFFDLSPHVKDALAWENPRANRGYTAQGRERSSLSRTSDDVDQQRAQAPDVKETFEMGRDDDPEWKNQWPDSAQLPHFKETMQTFFTLCHDLHLDILRATALGLNLNEDYFDRTNDQRYHNLRILHYPPVQNEAIKKGECARVHAHTDYGSLTLLFQDDVGGLEVHDARIDKFIAVPPMPGGLIVNAGDILTRWSNGRLRSALHRVASPPNSQDIKMLPGRRSIAFFCNPNYDAVIECIPGCEGPMGARYEPINFGDYITGRLAATYK